MTEMVRKWKVKNTKIGGIDMTKKEEIVNGNMTNSLDEVKLLGKQMEDMRDEQQLAKTNRIADPQQFDDEELDVSKEGK